MTRNRYEIFETSTLEVDGSKIAVSDVGQRSVLLFVHTGFWSFIWRDVISRLAGEFRCVCFDAPGTGRGDRIPLAYISLDRASRVVTAVIQALDLRDITLIVHDLGGPSGIAGAAPVADRIQASCAVNTFAWKPSGAAFRGMLALMGSRFIQELDVALGILPRISVSSFGVRTPDGCTQPENVSFRNRKGRPPIVSQLHARRYEGGHDL